LAFSFQIGETRISAATADEIVAFMTGPNWDIPLRYFSTLSDPGKPLLRRPGMLRPKILAATLREALLHDGTTTVRLRLSERTTPDFASCSFDTQTFDWKPRIMALGFRPSGMPSTLETWLQGSLRVAAAARSPMGVVAVFEDSDEAKMEIDVLTSYSPEDSRGPYRPQWLRMAAHSAKVGTRYVRFPRWGTLYSRAHVAELGGTAAIVDAVRPTVVRELPGGMYFQLTDSLDTALSPDALAKQRRFEDLAAPLLPPHVPDPHQPRGGT
jgi:hypothetical protein